MTEQRMDIEIVLDEFSNGSVKLNGEEVGGRVKSVQLFSTAAEPTYLILKVWPTSVRLTAPDVEVNTQEADTPSIAPPSRADRDLAVNGRYPDQGHP